MKISVIIPTYNRKSLTERAVASVLRDPALPAGVEVMVSDDGSTDGTREHLERVFAQEISSRTLILLEAPRTADPGATRNFGVAHASGEYVAFLDSDDYWKPGRLKRVLESIDGFDGLCESECAPSQSDFIEALLASGFAPTSSYVWRLSHWKRCGEFSVRYYGPKKRWDRGWEDYEAWLRCATTPIDGRLPRVRVLSPSLVVLEEQVGGAGRVQLSEQMRREFWSLIRGLRGTAWLWKPKTWKRLGGAIKAGWILR